MKEANKARLFQLHSFRDFTQVLKGTRLNEASAEVTVFGVLPGLERRERLRQALCGRQISLAHVLEPKEVFADIAIGQDIGYMDVLIVASLENLQPPLDTLCSAFQERIVAFEKRGSLDMPTYLAALGTLAGVR